MQDLKAKEDALFKIISAMPIIDYHSHLDPKAIYLDLPFENIGELLLGSDHYKWRLMRTYGVPEKYITGNQTTIKEKFIKFASVVSTAYGNPIRDWLKLELLTYFNISTQLNESTALDIWERANEHIKKTKLSPRKCLKMLNVEYVATTDDICDTLEFHKKIEDKDLTVAPTFRTDNLMELRDDAYIKKLETISGIKIAGISQLENAILNRIKYFKNNGCKFSDIGIENFPTRVATKEASDLTIKKLLAGEKISPEEREGLQGYLYVFLGKSYFENDIVMQIHIGPLRNPNTLALEQIGKDAGFDSVGDVIKIRALSEILDRMGSCRPMIIVYTLNPSMYYPLISLCGSFPRCMPGVAWWFNDHKRGIYDYLESVSELAHIGAIPGMLTDSRSFLSYVRHEYFRKELASFLAKYIDDNNFEEVAQVGKDIAYNNIKKIIV